MEKLRGPEALNVIIKKFSDSCGVVKCVTDFFKSVAAAEETYANSLSKLTKSGIPFRSTLFMRLFDLEPHQELQSFKTGWETLGSQLRTLADHHREKASSYLTKVRQPLLELLPKLEERKRKLMLECAELTRQLEAAKKKHTLNRKKYNELGDKFQKMDSDLDKARSSGNTKVKLQLEPRILVLSSEVQQQEQRYRQSLRELHQMHASFDGSVLRICKDIQAEEIKRIKAISDSLREFTRILSNTCPMYLSGMQYITLSLEEISAEIDLEGFAQKHKELMQEVHLPEFEMHPCRAKVVPPPPTGTKKDGHKHPGKWSKEEENENAVEEDEENKENSEAERKEDDVQQDSVEEMLNKEPPVPPPTSSPTITEVEIHPPPPLPPQQPPTQLGENSHPHNSTESAETPVGSSTVNSKTERSSAHSDETTEDGSWLPESDVKSDTVEGAVAMLTPNDPGDKMAEVLETLKQHASENDYYSLLGATASSTASELAQCRRDRSQELHPDHFVNDPEKQKTAEDKLSLINLAYTNVLKQENTRSLYNQLCKFRKGYSKFPGKGKGELKVAKDKLQQLQKSLKRSGSPNSLLREIDCALQLIQQRLQILEEET